MYLKAGTFHAKLAKEYRIGRATVGDLKKNKEKIRSCVSTMDSMALHISSYLAIYKSHYGQVSEGPLYSVGSCPRVVPTAQEKLNEYMQPSNTYYP